LATITDPSDRLHRSIAILASESKSAQGYLQESLLEIPRRFEVPEHRYSIGSPTSILALPRVAGDLAPVRFPCQEKNIDVLKEI
jgi:hypothetical protein